MALTGAALPSFAMSRRRSPWGHGDSGIGIVVDSSRAARCGMTDAEAVLFIMIALLVALAQVPG